MRPKTLLLVAATVAIALPGTVLASTPGHNGLISFRRYLNADHSNGALFTINPDGTHERQITFPAADTLDNNQNWSPDGTKLVFERDTPATAQLYTVNADGSNLHLVFPCPGDDSCLGAANPSWSPDGRWIAFQLALGPVVNDWAADVSVWEVHPDGTGLRQVTHASRDGYEDNDPNWSPDGSRLVIQRNTHTDRYRPTIWAVDSNDGGHPVRVSPVGVNASDHPDWSPDGQWIVFRTDNGVPGSAKVFLAHQDGSGLHVILDGSNTRQFLSYSFSPDGTKLLIGMTPGSGPEGNADVYIASLDANARVSGIVALTQTDAWDSSPRWGVGAANR